MSVDAFDVKVKDAIGQLGAQAIVDQCAAGCNAALRLHPAQCRHGPVSGTCSNPFINMAEARVGRHGHRDVVSARRVEWFGGGERIVARLLATPSRASCRRRQVGAATVDRVGQTGVHEPDWASAPDWQGTVSFGVRARATRRDRFRGATSTAVRTTRPTCEGVDIDDNNVASTLPHESQ